ncbi:unnamed protein product [Lymnaea stagnalis]|uniref:Uncharacterized protein n=1 Tax=Lymnaea stagnalis TaxID=6523 RepID=A0AAV2HPG9_LYMST
MDYTWEIRPAYFIGSAALATGAGLHLAGLLTPRWTVISEDVHIGLFEWCSFGVCTVMLTDRKPASLLSCQVLAILGSVSGCLALLLTLFYLALLRCGCGSWKGVLVGASCFSTLAFLSIVINACVWSSRTIKDLHGSHTGSMGYSYVLSCVGGGVLGAAGIYLVPLGRYETSEYQLLR